MLLNNALFTLSLAAWIAVLGFILIYLLRTAQLEGWYVALRRVFTERLMLIILIAAVVITFVSNGVVFIQPQEVGVVVSLLEERGIHTKPLEPGLHVIVPLVEQVYRYPTFYQNYTISSVPNESTLPGDQDIAARTSDGQAVYIELTIIFSIDPKQVVNVHLGWQDRYVANLISPLIRGIVRAQVSQFTVDQVNSQNRQQLEDNIASQLRNELKAHGFVLNRFLLRNISFSAEYAQAVEEKQVALQNVIRDSYQAQQTQIVSQAQADALTRLGEALGKNPDVATLEYIDKLAPSITTLLVPNNVPFILPLPTAFSRQNAAGQTETPPATAGVPTPTPTLFVPVPTIQLPTPLPTVQPVSTPPPFQTLTP